MKILGINLIIKKREVSPSLLKDSNGEYLNEGDSCFVYPTDSSTIKSRYKVKIVRDYNLDIYNRGGLVTSKLFGHKSAINEYLRKRLVKIK